MFEAIAIAYAEDKARRANERKLEGLTGWDYVNERGRQARSARIHAEAAKLSA